MGSDQQGGKRARGGTSEEGPNRGGHERGKTGRGGEARAEKDRAKGDTSEKGPNVRELNECIMHRVHTSINVF
jgi:hypothetical protein